MKIKWDRVLLEPQIKYIKWATMRNYCLFFFKLKNLMIRLLGCVLITFISSLLFFLFRVEALNGLTAVTQFNTGLGWSIGAGWNQSLIYFLKIIPTIIFFIMFLCFKQWYAYFGIFLIAINSLLNIIDKSIVDVYFDVSHYHSVVDYFYWPAFGFTNNMADIFIVLGLGLTIISVLYILYEEYRNSKKCAIEENDHSPDNSSQK